MDLCSLSADYHLRCRSRLESQTTANPVRDGESNQRRPGGDCKRYRNIGAAKEGGRGHRGLGHDQDG
ncbi:hypothetical protein SDC9_156270 [bioreactor metagenome]|uniref:Uncharacterized protein n=1 Tax=bioreactor metagenome TaxID=1076179 RepID=A0A645F621_9ZZZZ